MDTTDEPRAIISDDILASLRANPVLASLSEDALARIAEVVAADTEAQVDGALRDVELFEGLSENDLSELHRISRRVVVEEGDVLFEEGDPGEDFYVIVRGAVELRKEGGGDMARLAVLRSGQAFGEMALLNEAPRSASAHVVESGYLIAISRGAFATVLGGDTLAVRLLRSMAKALWATSVRLTAKHARAEAPREALSEFNRMVRTRLLPRSAPRVEGFDISASTLAHDHGDGAAAWDWFELPDGRPVLVVLKVDQANLSAAHRLGIARILLRDHADECGSDLGALLTRVNRSLHKGWVEGLSGSVTCGLLALNDEGVELGGAGGVVGSIVRVDGSIDDLVAGAPSLGQKADTSYASTFVRLDEGDRIVAFSDGPEDSVAVAHEVLAMRELRSSKEALATLFGRLKTAEAGVEGIFDLTAALVIRTSQVAGGNGSTADAVARASAAFEASMEAGEGEPTG